MIDAGRLDELPDRSMRTLEHEGQRLGVVRWGDEVFALRSRCPHQGGPLCLGTVGPQIIAQAGVGTMELDADSPVVVCPWHGWEFDPRTGRAVVGRGRSGPPYRVQTFRALVRDGRILVDLDG
jgi:nitrite reductase (NADH) small subunit